jgi:hypothetical protein
LGIGLFLLFMICVLFLAMLVQYIGFCISSIHKHKWGKWEEVREYDDYWSGNPVTILYKKCPECGIIKYKKIKS